MNIDDDDQLLAALSQTFAGEMAAQPSDDERAAVRALVEQRRVGAVVIPITRHTSRFARRVAISGVAVLVGLSGATAVAAAANNGALPNPIRRVVVAVGLPVDSVSVADVKDALRQLRGAAGADIPAAIERVEHSAAALSPAEHAPLASEIELELAAARSRLTAYIATTTPATSPPTTSGTTTFVTTMTSASSTAAPTTVAASPPLLATTTRPRPTEPVSLPISQGDDHGGSGADPTETTTTRGGGTSGGGGDDGDRSGSSTVPGGSGTSGDGGSGTSGSGTSGSGSGGAGSDDGSSGRSGGGGNDGSASGSTEPEHHGSANSVTTAPATSPPREESSTTAASTRTSTSTSTTTTTTAPSSGGHGSDGG